MWLIVTGRAEQAYVLARQWYYRLPKGKHWNTDLWRAAQAKAFVTNAR